MALQVQNKSNVLKSQILAQLKTLNDPLTAINELDSVKNLKRIAATESQTSANSYKFYAGLIIVVLTCIYCNLFKFLTKAPNAECLIKIPNSLENLLLLPRFDCSLCANLTSVDKVENLSKDLFEKKYAYTAIPVVVKDGTSNWTTSIFDFNFFKDLYLNHSENILEAGCQFFPYKTNFKNLLDVFEMDENRANLVENTDPWYVGWSNCDPATAAILRKHYEKPYFLPQTSESMRTDWIFMGSPGYGAEMHVDKVGHPSWQAQIKGSKHWTLEPFPECYWTCRTLEVVVEPGEIIVLDTDKWFHQTQIVGKEISITIGTEYD